MTANRYSFEDWDSGKIKLSNEIFRPEWGGVVGHTYEKGHIIEHRQLIGYIGEETGTRLGTWFSEVMEPI